MLKKALPSPIYWNKVLNRCRTWSRYPNIPFICLDYFSLKKKEYTENINLNSHSISFRSPKLHQRYFIGYYKVSYVLEKILWSERVHSFRNLAICSSVGWKVIYKIVSFNLFPRLDNFYELIFDYIDSAIVLED